MISDQLFPFSCWVLTVIVIFAISSHLFFFFFLFLGLLGNDLTADRESGLRPPFFNHTKPPFKRRRKKSGCCQVSFRVIVSEPFNWVFDLVLLRHIKLEK